MYGVKACGSLDHSYAWNRCMAVADIWGQVIVMAFQLNQNVLCLERILGAADVCQSGAGSWADEEAVLLRTQL